MPTVSQFSLNDTPATNVTVTSVTVTEALNAPYRIVLGVLTTDNTLPETINQSCSFDLEELDVPRVFTGIVQSVSFRGVQAASDASRYVWTMVVVPRLSLLAYTTRSRVFATDTPLTIAKLLTGALPSDTTSSAYVTVDTSGITQHPDSFAMSIQWRESDLDYVMRKAEQAGIGFYFVTDASPLTDKVCFFDTNGALPPMGRVGSKPGLAYRPDRSEDSQPALRSFSLDWAIVPATATVGAYDYRSTAQTIPETQTVTTPPSRACVGSSIDVDGPAIELCVTPGTADTSNQTTTWMKQLATEQAQRAALSYLVMHGTSDYTKLAAGTVFPVRMTTSQEGNPTYKLVEQEWIVLSVEHEAVISTFGTGAMVQPGSLTGTTIHYTNSFTAIPYTTPYVPARRTPVPAIAGLVRAVIDPTPVAGTIPTRANLDTLGCYWLKFPFDARQTALTQTQWSAPVRMLTGYGGPKDPNGDPTGLFLSLLPNTEVMVGFIGGDPDRPVIVGPAYDAVNPSVVVGASGSTGTTPVAQNVIRTPSGVVMKIFDGPGPSSSGTST